MTNDQKPIIISSNYLFVLDIGTRFVRGLICERASTGGPLKILFCEIREHQTRAMRAGQIHDIEKVAGIVKEIKEALESSVNGFDKSLEGAFRLSKVAAAVAGRNLVTFRGRAAAARKNLDPITEEEVKQLELCAVQKAFENIDDTLTDFYCVGYSAAGCIIDGQEIAVSVGHRGAAMETEALVTLLPRQVLEAMFTVARKLDLEIEYLTLEPIAALESTASENLRSLSIILIDIGAGTSDIAVIANNRVLAYGMVPAAGDMITEALCGEYLINFDTAEKIKRDISRCLTGGIGGTADYKDIFNRGYSKPLSEIFEKMRQPVREMAERVAREIYRIVPAGAGIEHNTLEGFAVVLVGGGSMTPSLEDELSRALKISKERIGVRPIFLNNNIEDMSGKLSGPEAATVAGIGFLARSHPGLSMVHIILNEKRITMVSPYNCPSVLSVFLSQGITLRQIYGRPGLAKTFTLNGDLHSIKGSMPDPAVIELNGKKAALDTVVREGDSLTFYPARDGKDAQKSFKGLDAVPLAKITFNGKQVLLPARIIMNGAPVGADAHIEDMARIEYTTESDISKVLSCLGVDAAPPAQAQMRVYSDGEEAVLTSMNYILRVNDVDFTFEQPVAIKENDTIYFEKIERKWRVADIIAPPPPGKDLHVKINGGDYTFTGGQGKILLNGKETGMNVVLHDGDILSTVSGRDASPVLVDVFNCISVEPAIAHGKKIRLLIDGCESQFTSPLHQNAEIKVLFE